MHFFKSNLAQFSLLIAAISIAGSLIFSEVLGFAPCILCWWQRIFMYPLVIILAIGIWKKDKNLRLYVLPFSIIGLIISFYQVLLYYNIIPEITSSCTIGVSCDTRYLEWFGIIDIPQLSFLAFLIITIFMYFYKKNAEYK